MNIGIPTRPMNGVEMTQRKFELLGNYRDAGHPFNDAVNLRMMTETLYHTPDVAHMSAYSEKSAHIPDDRTDYTAPAGAVYELSDWDAFEQKMSEDYIPLGGMAEGQKIRRVFLKDTMDTANSGLLIPQGIVPNLFVWLASKFQAWDQFDHVPANGVNHTWRNLVDYGDAEATAFIDEEGCPTSGRGVITAGSTNIAILAFKRTESLKMRLLEEQIGFRYNGMLPNERELRNAMISRARIAEKAFYQGTTASGHTGTDEFGTTYTNGFNGMRVLTSNTTMANGVNAGMYPAGFNPVVVEQSTSANAKTPITDALDAAIAQTFNNGGTPDRIHMPVAMALKLKQENADRVRYVVGGSSDANVVAGIRVVSFMSAIVGEIPITVVPDQSIGSYTIASITANGGATTYTPTSNASGKVMDAYIFSSGDVAFPYIGSEDPLPFETPVGTPQWDSVSGTLRNCLTRNLTIYLMFGLALYVPIHQAKVRLLA